jgi:hypothetical protein
MADIRVLDDLADLSVDVFELVDSGLEVESLTAGHRAVAFAGGARSCGTGGGCWIIKGDGDV